MFGGKAKDITAAKQFLREQGGIYTYFDAYSDLYRYKRERTAAIVEHACVEPAEQRLGLERAPHEPCAPL